jgi:hypothetical protein
MTKYKSKSGRVRKPHVDLVDNTLRIRLPAEMHYIGDALEVMLPGVLHKFAVHIRKGDWMLNGLTVKEALAHLRSEVIELEEAITSRSPQEVMMEASDVINQAMIIGTLFRSEVAPERKEVSWYGRNFVARSDGEVEFVDGIKRGQLVSFVEGKKGQYEVNMYGLHTPKGYRRTTRGELVLTAFKGPKPADYMEVDHKNGLKWDDRPDNLQWLPKTLNSAQSGRMPFK